MSTAGAILATLRPRQWVKNQFVVAPLVFSKHLLDPEFALRSAGAFASFCALSGAVYAFNDLRDAPLDRDAGTPSARVVSDERPDRPDRRRHMGACRRALRDLLA